MLSSTRVLYFNKLMLMCIFYYVKEKCRHSNLKFFEANQTMSSPDQLKGKNTFIKKGNYKIDKILLIGNEFLGLPNLSKISSRCELHFGPGVTIFVIAFFRISLLKMKFRHNDKDELSSFINSYWVLI